MHVSSPLSSSTTTTTTRAMHMGGNTLSDNRALLQVLTYSENMNKSPGDIVRSAVAGGVVGVFSDWENRYSELVLLPSSHDLTTLAILIAEGFFAPFLSRVLGDQHSRRTLVVESGCFECLALPVLIFPDCFLTPLLSDLALCKSSPATLPHVAVNALNTSSDTSFTQIGSSISPVVIDVQQLHRLRLQVALLLLKNINEVLHDAEVWRRKSSTQQTSNAMVSEVGTANAVLALFYEVKMLLLCCVVSSNNSYAADGAHDNRLHRTPQSCFDELLDSKELYRIFEERNRLGTDDMLMWYDAMLGRVTGMMSSAGRELQEFLLEVHTELNADSQNVSRIPTQLLHRPHDAVSTNVLQVPFVHVQLPRLALQPGELMLLFTQPLEQPLLDTEPLRLCYLLRRCTTVKLAATQARESEGLLAASQWHSLRGVVVESLRCYLSDTHFVCCMLEKNSSLVARLVQWLQEAPSAAECAEHLCKSGDCDDGNSLMYKSSVENNSNNDVDGGRGNCGGPDDLRERLALGMLLANGIIECAIQIPPFGTSMAQFMRDVVSSGALSERQLHAWMLRSLPDVENKPSATIGLFALVVAFSLAQRGWQLPEEIRERSIELCKRHRQQPDCLTLLNLLRRHSL